jgi:hypothetical protein
VNEDLNLMNEYDAVKKLIEKTRARFIIRGEVVWPTSELMQKLLEKFDHERRFLLDNGPTDDLPGVYVLGKDGYIRQYWHYAPLDPESYLSNDSISYGGNYHGHRLLRRHINFDE